MTAWCRAPERGAAWLVRLMLWLMRHAGWFARGIVLPGITAWFYAFSAPARAASREFLRAALGRPATARDVLRHIHSFANAILDRATLLTEGPDAIALDVSGLAHVEAAIAGGRGCLLLGAHLGSFAVLRQLAARCPVPVKALMWQSNAGAYSQAMGALDPSAANDVIPIGDVQSMLRVQEAVAAGAIVGVLADRAPQGARRLSVPFFGRPAAFPVGPFVLAASLGVPVLLFHGARTGRGRYQVGFAPFTERVVLRRATREADLHGVISRYAAWLEAMCQAYPFSWFNFFPFWEPVDHAATQARPAQAADRPADRPAGRAVLGAPASQLGPAAG